MSTSSLHRHGADRRARARHEGRSRRRDASSQRDGWVETTFGQGERSRGLVELQLALRHRPVRDHRIAALRRSGYAVVRWTSVPARVREYADQAVAYVRRALGVALEYDSDTLPAPRSLPAHGPDRAARHRRARGRDGGRVFRRGRAAPARRALGGERRGGRWRVVLPTGLNFSPAGFVASAIAQADLDDFDSETRRAAADAAVRPADARAHGRGLGRGVLLAVRPARHARARPRGAGRGRRPDDGHRRRPRTTTRRRSRTPSPTSRPAA